MRPRANVTMESLSEVVYEKSIGTKMTVRNFPSAAVSAATFGERPRQAADAAHLLIFGRQPAQVFSRPCRRTQSVLKQRRNF